MFGFARPHDFGDISYRSSYSRLCQYQHSHHGRMATLFHSYEATFLYVCAVDAGLVDKSCITSQRCCRLRSFPKTDKLPDADVAQFCTNVAMLLASVKLDDDISDNARVARFRATLFGWLFRKRFRRMREYFDTKCPELLSQLHQSIRDHGRMERAEPSNVTMDGYVAPTANCFALVFESLPQMLGREELKDKFHQIGTLLGSALLSFDCGVDWERDLQTGDYNIVRDEESAMEALQYSQQNLTQLAKYCTSVFTNSCLSAFVARSVHETISSLLSEHVAISSTKLERRPDSACSRFSSELGQNLRQATASTAYCDPCTYQLFRIACHAGLNVACRPTCDRCLDDCLDDCK